MSSGPKLISESNLSLAWLAAAKCLVKPGRTEISPLVVTFGGVNEGEPVEDPTVRGELDQVLAEREMWPIQTVANTIFPKSYWNPQLSRQDLYERFDRAWPKIRRVPQNRLGTYFRRITHYKPKDCIEPVNQLEHVISTYQSGNHRRSALQTAIFDPTLDHSNSPVKGFPCLQQVAFNATANDGLTVCGFYAMQYISDRGYGNFLGLARLGNFVAKNLDMEFKKVTCVANVAQLGTINKTQLRDFLNRSQLANVVSSLAVDDD